MLSIDYATLELFHPHFQSLGDDEDQNFVNLHNFWKKTQCRAFKNQRFFQKTSQNLRRNDHFPDGSFPV
jgi:hypothetical protein